MVDVPNASFLVYTSYLSRGTGDLVWVRDALEWDCLQRIMWMYLSTKAIVSGGAQTPNVSYSGMWILRRSPPRADGSPRKQAS